MIDVYTEIEKDFPEAKKLIEKGLIGYREAKIYLVKRDFKKMQNEGIRVVDIFSELSEKYCVSESSVLAYQYTTKIKV